MEIIGKVTTRWRFIIAVLIVVGFALSMYPSLFISANPAGGNIISHWTMDDNAASTTITDSEGSNDGIASANTDTFASTAMVGGVGGAQDFNGANHSINATSNATLDNVFDSGGTFIAWINPDSDGEGNLGRIADKAKWIFNVEQEVSSKVKLNFNFDFDTTDGNWTTSSTQASTNAWTFVAVTYDTNSTANDPTIYINGQSATISEGLTPGGTRVSDALDTLYLGNDSTSAYTFDGDLDDVRVYSDALSDIQIYRIYRQTMKPIAHWKMNDNAASTTVADSGLYSNTGTLAGGDNTEDISTTDATFDRAMEFDGSSDYVSVGDNLDQTTNDFSLMAWVKTTDAGEIHIVTKRDKSVSSNPGYSMLLLNGDLYSAIADSSGSLRILNNTTNTIDDGNWHHVAETFDRDGNVVHYIDGVNKGSFDISAQQLTVANAVNLYVGAQDNNGVVESYFNGVIDDVRIYDRALRANEIKDLYAEGATQTGRKVKPAPYQNEPDLVGYWKLDDNAANTTVTDYSGMANHGTAQVNTNTTSTTDARFDRAMEFDGSSDYVDAGNDSSLDITDSITIASWVKSSSIGTIQSIVSKRATAQADETYGFAIYQSKVIFSSGATALEHQGATILLSDEWYHLSVTWDTSNVKLYVNGVEDYSGAESDSTTANNADVLIGALLHSGSIIQKFNGSIDDVRIYSRALTANEIYAQYAAGRQRTGDNGFAKGKRMPIDQSVVGYWKLNDASGQTTIKDYTSNGNDGTSANNKVDATDPWGVSGGAMTFNGSSDYVAKTFSNFRSGDNTGSISLWFRTPSLANQYFFSSGDTATNNWLFGFAILNGKVYVHMNYGGTSAPNSLDIETDDTFNDNNWHNAVLNSDGSTYTIYVDGVNRSLTVNFGNNDGKWFNDIPNRDNINIGVMVISITNWFFDGSLSDVRIYDRALSPSEIKQMYMRGRQ